MLRSTPCGRGGLLLGSSPLAMRSVQSPKYWYGTPPSGILAGDYCTIRRCDAGSNFYQGIQADDNAVVEDCNVFSNGSASSYAGVYISGSSGRIEHNVINENRYGLFVSGVHNIIVRNSCRANAVANYSVGPNNEYAPVITNPGSNGFATMTPYSNIAY